MSLQNSSTRSYSNGQTSNRNGSTASNDSQRSEFRFLVCSRDAGAIIGKKGSNIQGLRQKHRAIIQVPDCDGPERILFIQGEYDRCLGAIVDILPLMKDNQRVQNEQSEIRLLVHQSQAGAVIGKGGERVRELRTKYNVGMKVFVQCLPFSTERVAALRGRSEDIERCLRQIFEILDKTPIKGQTCLYDPINFDRTASSEYGGFADGAPANNTNSSNSRGSNESKNRSPSDSNVDLDDSKIEANRVSIPDKYISAIVGPRQAKISEIRQISRASIQIEEATDDSDERVITIKGTNSQINDALELLRTAVRQSGLWIEN